MVRDSMPLAEDRDAIIEVLQFTDKVLDLLINRLSPPDLQLFQDAWNETRPVLQEQISLLQAISSETNSVWTVIQRVGLTGKSLAMKLHYLAQAAIGGWPKKLLDLLNRFLGSLVAGLPGTEQIKELKEWLEEQIGDDSTPDQELVSLYNDQGYKHFRATP